MTMSGIRFVSNGYDDSHTAHFEMMLEHLVGIYEEITATDRSPA
jgi:hypothetical protein